MAWTQTLALWKSNAAPPCSGRLIAKRARCSLAAVFFPLCLAWNAREVISRYIHRETIRLRADEDAPFKITERSGTPKMIQGGCFLENHLILWPCLITILSGKLKRLVEGWTRSFDLILNFQPSQFSAKRLPSTELWLEASGHSLQGPGEEAPLICNSEMQRHSGERCFVSPFVCTHGFHFEEHSTVVGPCSGA